MIYGYYYMNYGLKDDEALKKLLKAENADVIIYDEYCSAGKEKYNFSKLISDLKQFDMVILPSLINVFSSTREMVKTFKSWTDKGVEYKVLSLPDIDTTGKFRFELKKVVTAFANFRTETELAKDLRKKNGRMGEKRKDLSGVVKYIFHLYTKEKLSVTEIKNQLSVSRASVYKYLKLKGLTTKDHKDLRKIRNVNAIKKIDATYNYLKSNGIKYEPRSKKNLDTESIRMIIFAFEILKIHKKSIVDILKKSPDDLILLKSLIS